MKLYKWLYLLKLLCNVDPNEGKLIIRSGEGANGKKIFAKQGAESFIDFYYYFIYYCRKINSLALILLTQ